MPLHRLSRLNARNALYVAEHYAAMPEADPSHNDMQRRIIEAVRDEYGQAWLGLINRPSAEQSEPPIWEWTGAPVWNFGADFVLPKHDMQLEVLLRQREAAPYTGTADDLERIEKIVERVNTVGGYHLLWT